MCGRYTIAYPDAVRETLERLLGLPVKLPQRFNIAPTQLLPVLRQDDAGEPAAVAMRWGFVASWEKTAKPKLSPFNARVETLAESRLFRSSLHKRRCLVPADGFYEWRNNGSSKTPLHITLRDQRPFCFAGIWSPATPHFPESYAILTTQPNELMSTIHNRMPVMLEGRAALDWMQAGEPTEELMRQTAEPFPASAMIAREVSTLVNNARHEDPRCIEPVDNRPMRLLPRQYYRNIYVPSPAGGWMRQSSCVWWAGKREDVGSLDAMHQRLRHGVDFLDVLAKEADHAPFELPADFNGNDSLKFWPEGAKELGPWFDVK